MYYEVFIAGSGGQGVLLMGNIISFYAMLNDLNTTFMPSYGVEMRGGMTHCTVIISDEEIGSPVLQETKNVLIMSPFAIQFTPMVKEGGILILNSSLIKSHLCQKENVKVLKQSFNDLALKAGSSKVANMIALGYLWGVTRPLPLKEKSLEEAMIGILGEAKKRFIPANIDAFLKGYELGEKEEPGNS